MTQALSPIQTRPGTLADVVYDAIREAIVSRRLGPGEQVSEASLSSQLQVSKTPVREALLRLVHVGLIEPAADRRPARVVTPSPDAIRAAYQVREALEVQATRIVAAEGSPQDVADILTRAQQSVEAAYQSDSADFRASDRAFHFAIVQAANQPPLSRFVRDIYDLTWTLRMRDAPRATDSRTCAQQHVEIAEAIAKRDVQGADEAMRAHVHKVQELVLAGFADGSR